MALQQWLNRKGEKMHRKISQSLRALALSIAFGMLMVAVPIGVADAAPPDLAGSWTGAAECTGFFAGEKYKETFTSVVNISQSGADINMSFLGVDYNGAVIEDGKDSRKGEGSFLSCGTQVEPIGDFNEIGHMIVQVDNAKNKTSFKAVSVYVVGVGNVATCKWAFERTSASDPFVPDCAP
jgi:hypothetical protein